MKSDTEISNNLIFDLLFSGLKKKNKNQSAAEKSTSEERTQNDINDEYSNRAEVDLYHIDQSLYFKLRERGHLDY